MNLSSLSTGPPVDINASKIQKQNRLLIPTTRFNPINSESKLVNSPLFGKRFDKCKDLSFPGRNYLVQILGD